MKPRLNTSEMTIWIKIAEGDQTSWMARLISCIHLNFLSDQVSWLLSGAKWTPGSDLNPSWKGKYTGTQRKKRRAKITSWLQIWDIISITGFNTWYYIFCQFLPVYIIISFKRYSPKGLFVNQFSCSVMSDSLQPHGLQHTNFPVHHQLPELTQTHVHWVDDAIQPSHSLSSPSPPAFNLFSIRVFFSESVLRIRWPKYWSFSFSISPSNEYSGLISFKMDWLDLLASPGDSQESSPTPQ